MERPPGGMVERPPGGLMERPLGGLMAPARAGRPLAAPGSPAVAVPPREAGVSTTSGGLTTSGVTSTGIRPVGLEPSSPVGMPDPGTPANPPGARPDLRQQMQEQKRVRTMAMAVVVTMLLGAPMLYFGILFATRDPALNSLDQLAVPEWAAQSPEDRIINGSRWCFIDCRRRERTLVSLREPVETTEAYQVALREAGWVRWDVPGCPLAEVDGDYSCWTRDEYTLDLWVRPPECAYDPLNLRPELAPDDEEESDDADPAGEEPAGEAAGCIGSVVEIKMQNRVADERGQPGAENGYPGTDPPAGSETPDPSGSDAPAPPATEAPADDG